MQILPLLLNLIGCADVVVPFQEIAPERPESGDVIAPYGTADWTVDCNGGADFDSIQDAIDAAVSGDWILVEPCTYRENLNYNGRSLYIQGREGPENTILDASGGYGLIAMRGETSQTAFTGFTIENANGAAVYASLASIHLEDVVITGTRGDFIFAGYGADTELTNVEVTDNNESTAVVYTDRGSVQIDNSRLECGGSRIGLYLNHGAGQVDNSVVDCGRNYSMYATNTVGHIQRSILRGSAQSTNEDKHPEDSIDLYNVILEGSYTAVYGNYMIVNSIIDGGSISYTNSEEYPSGGVLANSIVMNSTCALNSAGTNVVVHTNFYDTTPSCTGETLVGVEDNTDVDPEFVDAAGGDFHLAAGSPLRDAGTTDYTGADVDGTDNDVGVYGGQFSLDGGW